MSSYSERSALLSEKTISVTTPIIIIACCIVIPLVLLGISFIYSKRTKKRNVWEEDRSGATATSGGLVFVSGTEDNKIRAFDSSNGKELWFHEMPFQGSAPPTVYMINNKQYIIVPAFEKNGNELLAFSIE